MRTRIRIDNDFVFLWSIERGDKVKFNESGLAVSGGKNVEF